MSAKDIILKPISSIEASAVIRRIHYSGKSAATPQVNIGVYYRGKLEGALQFGTSLDKRKVQGLVSGTGWNNFLELNRMAFSDALPRNSESRALAIALRMLRKHAPHLEWIVSYSDGTQCGDGTIYRASGFSLTAITPNTTIYCLPDGFIFADIGLRVHSSRLAERVGYRFGEPFRIFAERVGAVLVSGFQLRYIYFLDPTCRERLTVPELPFSRIQEMGAGMYKGERRTLPASVGSIDNDAAVFQTAQGGASPTPPLQTQER